jgi:hypothetical protein
VAEALFINSIASAKEKKSLPSVRSYNLSTSGLVALSRIKR